MHVWHIEKHLIQAIRTKEQAVKWLLMQPRYFVLLRKETPPFPEILLALIVNHVLSVLCIWLSLLENTHCSFLGVLNRQEGMNALAL